MTWLQKSKPLTLLALMAAVVCSYYELYWPWGLLFLYWSWGSIMTGEAFLVERLSRGRHPLHFWLVTVMWAGFGAGYVYGDLVWRLT